jgi:hypothetical protein
MTGDAWFLAAHNVLDKVGSFMTAIIEQSNQFYANNWLHILSWSMEQRHRVVCMVMQGPTAMAVNEDSEPWHAKKRLQHILKDTSIPKKTRN